MTAWAVALGVLGALLGRQTGGILGTYGYRIDEDAPSGVPGRRWWPVVVLGGTWAALTVRLVPAYGWPTTTVWLLLAWLGVALTWIDLDVHRLPDGLVLPAYPAVLVLTLVAAIVGPAPWLRALACGAVCFALFWLLAILPGGGMGGGDVKLAGLLGFALGWLGVASVVVWFVVTFLVGGVVAVVLLVSGRTGAKGHFAFGPAMCFGALVAAGWAMDLLTALVMA